MRSSIAGHISTLGTVTTKPSCPFPKAMCWLAICHGDNGASFKVGRLCGLSNWNRRGLARSRWSLLEPSSRSDNAMSTLLRTEPEVVVGPEPLAPRIVSVSTRPNSYSVVAEFETGERRVYNVMPLIGRGVFETIRDSEAFTLVSVVEGGGGIEWASGPDLSRNSVYFDGQSV